LKYASIFTFLNLITRLESIRFRSLSQFSSVILHRKYHLSRWLSTEKLIRRLPLDEKSAPYTQAASAARMYFRCRKKGMTINSTVDCLIAQTAIENNSYLLHNDSDFDNIAKVAALKMLSL
jgi:predicted nucleic acid-binding protein